jgi:hypothetical protein
MVVRGAAATFAAPNGCSVYWIAAYRLETSPVRSSWVRSVTVTTGSFFLIHCKSPGQVVGALVVSLRY